MCMTIVEALRWQCGRFVIQQRPRPDNPAWAVYIVILDAREIGRSFSLPDVDCCEWLLHQPDGTYAPPSMIKHWSYTERQRKRGRPSKAELAARALEPEEVF